MHGNKYFENVSDCFNANVTLTTFLDHIYINVIGEPVQEHQAYISWLFHIANTLA